MRIRKPNRTLTNQEKQNIEWAPSKIVLKLHRLQSTQNLEKKLNN